MSDSGYRFFHLDVSNIASPTVLHVQGHKNGKESAYKKLRKMATQAAPRQLIIMQLPCGGLRTINPKGEVVMLNKDLPPKALKRLLPTPS
ncbi:MAG: hypothetical protein INF43_01840 [Alphaproteobacteria bacterium]|nr:hypothetical protein [Alphaproteobacteria bacterium]